MGRHRKEPDGGYKVRVFVGGQYIPPEDYCKYKLKSDYISGIINEMNDYVTGKRKIKPSFVGEERTYEGNDDAFSDEPD